MNKGMEARSSEETGPRGVVLEDIGRKVKRGPNAHMFRRTLS